jgi:hypothetical protein
MHTCPVAIPRYEIHQVFKISDSVIQGLLALAPVPAKQVSKQSSIDNIQASMVKSCVLACGRDDRAQKNPPFHSGIE